MSTTAASPSARVAATQGPGGLQQVTINATDEFTFEPAAITAHPGKVAVTLVDVGSYPHNLAVDVLNFTSDTVTDGIGRDTTMFTLTFDEPGTYEFVCTFHSSAGMRGQFVIG
jgi:plastocyanin